MKEETVESSENTGDRVQAKSFVDLIAWQKMIYPLITIYSLLSPFYYILATISIKKDVCFSPEKSLIITHTKRYRTFF
ncbi:MAG: hypothetical protein PWQ43_552 [Rikenellaceae bacterium]|nr:hypothetical protein [Rikenellaceae bacterium]MDN5355610.1 hypothetical protein [Rikenellaceae bacterium]